MDENKSASELNEALKGVWDSLTDEQREKAKACKSMDELTALAGKLGVELPDEALDKVAGGVGENRWTDTFSEDGSCPECRSNDPDVVEWEAPSAGIKYCNNCYLRYRTHIAPQFQ